RRAADRPGRRRRGVPAAGAGRADAGRLRGRPGAGRPAGPAGLVPDRRPGAGPGRADQDGGPGGLGGAAGRRAAGGRAPGRAVHHDAGRPVRGRAGAGRARPVGGQRLQRVWLLVVAGPGRGAGRLDLRRAGAAGHLGAGAGPVRRAHGRGPDQRGHLAVRPLLRPGRVDGWGGGARQWEPAVSGVRRGLVTLTPASSASSAPPVTGSRPAGGSSTTWLLLSRRPSDMRATTTSLPRARYG